jgi:hypothetical protein
MCESGLHACKHPFDALLYSSGVLLHKVELEEAIHGYDKSVGRRRKIVASIDTTGLLREFARWCALRVIDNWDATDVVRKYLETGNESLREEAETTAAEAVKVARVAAEESAEGASLTLAAWDAAKAAWLAAAKKEWRAASGAAWWSFEEGVAWQSQRIKFQEMIDEAFGD